MPPSKEELANRLRLLAREMHETAVELALFDVMEEWMEFVRSLSFIASETREVAAEVSEAADLTIH